jgi:hypothetical protein
MELTADTQVVVDATNVEKVTGSTFVNVSGKSAERSKEPDLP